MASPLEVFANTIRNLSAEGSYRDLCDYLTKSSDLLAKNTQHLDNVLETLDVQQHSLAILAILCAKFNAPASTAQNNRYNQAHDFILNCNGEHIRLAPEMFAELCHLITAYLVEQKQAIQGIYLIKKAISKMQLFDSQLTSIHADLCHLSLLAKCFKETLQVLDIDITGMCQESSANPPFDTKHYLLYFYYGGMIYLAVKNLDRALYFFEVCITTPAFAISHIMLEAYKKYILVALLSHGKVQTVPKYTSHVVTRFIKPLSQPYHDLASAFMNNNIPELNSVVTKNTELFARDHNVGLVAQVSTMMHKKNIQRLTKTFLTLSLADVALRIGLPGPADAEKIILHMIEDQQIFATINQKDGMVVFRDEPEKYNGPEVLIKLEAELGACMDLDRKIFTMDEEIQVNPQFVKKVAGVQDDDQPKNTYAM